MSHLYAEDPDLPPDHRGDGRCLCGRPKRNAEHDLPPVTAEQREMEARRLGEREEG